MRVMIAIFSDSELGNTANDTANFSLAKYNRFIRLAAIKF